MKNLLLTFIALIITVSCLGQQIIHQLPVVMKSVPDTGVASDSVVVIDASGNIKSRGSSNFGVGGGNIAGLYNEALKFTYGSGTTSPASAGTLRFNNASVASATEIYVSKLNANSGDIRNMMSLITDGSTIYIQKENGSTDFAVFVVNGNPSQVSGDYTIPVTYDNGLGSLAVSDDLYLSIMVSGYASLEVDPIYSIDSARIAKFDYGGTFTEPMYATGQALPWDANLIATLGYVYDNYMPFSESGFAGEALSSGDIVYQGLSNKWYKADADVLAQVSGRLGVVDVAAAGDGSVTGVRNFTAVNGAGFTTGDRLYLSNVPGAILTSPPPTGYARIIGTTISTTQRYFYLGNINYIPVDGSQVNGVSIATGTGDVSKVGTPVDNQVGVWTGDGTLEGTGFFTYDGTTFKVGDYNASGYAMHFNQTNGYLSIFNSFGENLKILPGGGTGAFSGIFGTGGDTQFLFENYDQFTIKLDAGATTWADFYYDGIDGGYLDLPFWTLAKQNAELSTSKKVGTIEYIRDYAATKGTESYSVTSASYTTNTSENGKIIDFSTATPTNIILDDTNVTIGDQFYFYNNTGTAMAWSFGGGSSAIEGTLSDLPDKAYGWARLTAVNTWSVVDGATAGGDVTKVGTMASSYIARWTGDGTLSGGTNLTFDGFTFGLPTASDIKFGTEGRIYTSGAGGIELNIGGQTVNQTINITSGTSGSINIDGGSGGINFLDDAVVPDQVYGAGWNGNLEVPTKNAIYDKIETISGGGLANIVEDTTPQLGGTLDAQYETMNNLSSLYFDSSSGANDAISIGNLFFRTFADVEIGRMFVRDAEMTMSHQSNFNIDVGTGGSIRYYAFYNSSVDFGGSTLGDVGFTNSNVSTTSTLAESKAGTLVFLTSGTAQTYTIPDTWTQQSGAQITFVNIGAGTATIAVSGTATLNGGANTIVLGGADSTGNESVMLVQQVNESDDWYSVGKY